MTAAKSSFAHRSRRHSAPISSTMALVLLALFAGVVALLGGSSRFDAVQIAALRPLAALFLIPALYYLSRDSIAAARTPVILFALLAGWTALQLVPLPPALWQALPGRAVYAELDALNGIGDAWRPIAVVPMRGWNALAAMVVPLTAMALALALRPSMRTMLILLVGLGVIDAALGLMQTISGGDSALYYYAQTNAGFPVGLFANENHSAAFSAIVLLVITRLGLSVRGRRLAGIEPAVLGAAYLLVLLCVLISGSRAGLALALGAVLASGIMAWLWLKRPQVQSGKSRVLAFVAGRPRMVLSVAIVLIAMLVLALLQFGRAPGAADVLGQDAFEDLRWRLLPILRDMIATHWLVGIGFGSFDVVYQSVEPDSFLSLAYLNQAHNDWAQWPIEGGLPAIVLLVLFGRWFYVALRSLWAKDASALARCVFWGAIVTIVALASFFDYPLRTPIFQMFATWLVIALAFDVESHTAGRHLKSD